MTPSQFTITTQRLDIAVKGVGLEAAADLATLIAGPVPMIPQNGWQERSKTPSSCRHMGKLITAGFATLDRKCNAYTVTDAGRAWFATLQKYNIAPK